MKTKLFFEPFFINDTVDEKSVGYKVLDPAFMSLFVVGKLYLFVYIAKMNKLQFL